MNHETGDVAFRLRRGTVRTIPKGEWHDVGRVLLVDGEPTFVSGTGPN